MGDPGSPAAFRPRNMNPFGESFSADNASPKANEGELLNAPELRNPQVEEADHLRKGDHHDDAEGVREGSERFREAQEETGGQVDAGQEDCKKANEAAGGLQQDGADGGGLQNIDTVNPHLHGDDGDRAIHDDPHISSNMGPDSGDVRDIHIKLCPDEARLRFSSLGAVGGTRDPSIRHNKRYHHLQVDLQDGPGGQAVKAKNTGEKLRTNHGPTHPGETEDCHQLDLQQDSRRRTKAQKKQDSRKNKDSRRSKEDLRKERPVVCTKTQQQEAVRGEGPDDRGEKRPKRAEATDDVQRVDQRPDIDGDMHNESIGMNEWHAAPEQLPAPDTTSQERLQSTGQQKKLHKVHPHTQGAPENNGDRKKLSARKVPSRKKTSKQLVVPNSPHSPAPGNKTSTTRERTPSAAAGSGTTANQKKRPPTRKDTSRTLNEVVAQVAGVLNQRTREEELDAEPAHRGSDRLLLEAIEEDLPGEGDVSPEEKKGGGMQQELAKLMKPTSFQLVLWCVRKVLRQKERQQFVQAQFVQME